MIKKSYLITSLALSLFIALGVFYLILNINSKDDFHGSYADHKLPNLELIDHNENPVSLSEFRGKLILLNFGYTSCPDICPATLANLRQVYNSFDNKEDIQILFISVDPKRDDFSKLKSYVTYFHDDFIGLSGTDEQMNGVKDAFSIFYFEEKGESEENYLVTHPTSIYLVDKSGKLILKYPHTVAPGDIVEDLTKLL